jgi:hypothetical protein
MSDILLSDSEEMSRNSIFNTTGTGGPNMALHLESEIDRKNRREAELLKKDVLNISDKRTPANTKSFLYCSSDTTLSRN